MKRRFYNSTASIDRAVAALLRRHGSPQAALAVIRPGLARIQQRTLRMAVSPEQAEALRLYGVRYGWRLDVCIELVQIANGRPRCKRCGGAQITVDGRCIFCGGAA